MTIKDLQANVESELVAGLTGGLPAQTKFLKLALESGYRVRAEIHHDGKVLRKVREDASADYFRPEKCALLLRFDPPEEDFEDAFEAQDEQLIAVLDRAEGARDFVEVGWFRDVYLPSQEGLAWTSDPRACARAVRRATDSARVLTHQTPNPKDSLHPLTAIRVNRSHPSFRARSDSSERRRARFRPIPIRGRSLSSTVLESRR